MLNTQKLLYILPDVAYIAELLPTKKEHTFSVHAFRQINGAFLDDDNFIIENVEKLVGKIEPEEYHLILPDFLFTNTIVQVQESTENKAKQYVKETLLPNIDIDPDTHEIDIAVLTQHQGKFKIQLSALEKEVLDPIVRSAHPQKVVITGVSPLSWTIKSVISLEPSISVIQVGSMLYSALHYIGIDQTTTTSVEELENVIETIKTLKGGEPSIQTVYLLTNALVEEKLKEALSGTLPIQQLAIFKEEETQMPSYVKQIIESGMKTLDIPDFPVPTFALPATPVSAAVAPKASESKVEEVEDVSTSDLPAPTPAPTMDAESDLAEDDLDDLDDDADLADDDDDQEAATELDDSTSDSDEPEDETEPAAQLEAGDELPALPDPPEPPSLPAPTPTTAVAAGAAVAKIASVEAVTLAATSTTTEPDGTTVEDNTVHESITTIEEELPAETESSGEARSEKTTTKADQDSDTAEQEMLAQFTAGSTENPGREKPSVKTEARTATPTKSEAEPPVPASRPSLTSVDSSHVTSSKTSGIIKNRNSLSPMLRMIFITLVVFAITVAVGVGVGLGVLSLSSQNDDFPESPVVTPSPSETPVSTASATPSPTASASAQTREEKAALRILVVNATTIPGHAGRVRTALESAGYRGVMAGNARGEYEAGSFVLLKDGNSGLAPTLSTDSKLDLTVKEGIAVEDPQGQYDAVIVLAE